MPAVGLQQWLPDASLCLQPKKSSCGCLDKCPERSRVATVIRSKPNHTAGVSRSKRPLLCGVLAGSRHKAWSLLVSITAS